VEARRVLRAWEEQDDPVQATPRDLESRVASALRAAEARGYKRAQDELLDTKDASQRPIVIDTRLTMRTLRTEPEATTDEMYGQGDVGGGRA
jgi:hypothetical protein